MKNFIIIAIVFVTLTFQIKAQEAAAPQISFEETVFNFDTIMQNDNGEHVFHWSQQTSDTLIETLPKVLILADKLP